MWCKISDTARGRSNVPGHVLWNHDATVVMVAWFGHDPERYRHAEVTARASSGSARLADGSEIVWTQAASPCTTCAAGRTPEGQFSKLADGAVNELLTPGTFTDDPEPEPEPEPVASVSRETTADDGPGYHVCMECGRTFRNAGGLGSHARTHQTDDGDDS